MILKKKKIMVIKRYQKNTKQEFSIGVMIRNVYRAATHIRMISEESCDTEEWNVKNKSYFKTELEDKVFVSDEEVEVSTISIIYINIFGIIHTPVTNNNHFWIKVKSRGMSISNIGRKH